MKHLTIAETETYTGLSRNTIMAWLKAGELKGRKTGPGTSPWLIPGDEVERVRMERIEELKAELAAISKPVPSNGNGEHGE